jgi:hypothetical protein
MQSDGKSSHGLWPGELKINQSINQSIKYKSLVIE